MWKKKYTYSKKAFLYLITRKSSKKNDKEKVIIKCGKFFFSHLYVEKKNDLYEEKENEKENVKHCFDVSYFTLLKIHAYVLSLKFMFTFSLEFTPLSLLLSL